MAGAQGAEGKLRGRLAFPSSGHAAFSTLGLPQELWFFDSFLLSRSYPISLVHTYRALTAV